MCPSVKAYTLMLTCNFCKRTVANLCVKQLCISFPIEGYIVIDKILWRF